MNKKIIVSLLALTVPLFTFAQLKVTSEGQVCVVRGTPCGNSLLTVGNMSAANFGNIGTCSLMSFSSATGGIKSFSSLSIATSNTLNNASTIGVMGAAANGYSGRLYGVLGCIPSSKVGAGIYGTTGTSGSLYGKLLSGTYAGYFEGATYVDGTLTATEVITPSDIRLKENVISVTEEEEKSGGSTLENLMGMNVIRYTYKPKTYTADKDGELLICGDKSSISQAEEAAKQEIRRMAEQQHYGLSAQELQKIYPNLVRESQDGTLGVNYVELVPILIRSIQELKQELEVLEGKGSRLTRSSFNEDRDQLTEDVTGNVLYQNTPNPFKGQTTIRFSLADDAQDASICIFDMSGKMLRKVPVSPEMTSISIDGYELSEGLYLYSLVVNGREIDTKKMIITR